MVLFLKVIAAVVLAIVLLGIVVFFLAVRWFKKLLKESERDHGSPCVVHLNEELHPQWIKTKPALKVIKELEDLGFIRGTAYGVDELKNASLFSMYHPKICSVINRTEEHGITVEFFHTSVDDTHIFISNQPAFQAEKSPPNMEVIHLPSTTSTAEVFRDIEARTKAMHSITYSNENFREEYERIYRENMYFRNKNGGLTYQTILNYLKLENQDSNHSEEEKNEIFLKLKVEELDHWEELALQEHDLNHPRREETDNSIKFIVPNKTDAEAFVHYLAEQDIIREDHVEQIGKAVKNQQDISALFSTINKARSPNLRAILCGEVEFPVPASIYEISY